MIASREFYFEFLNETKGKIVIGQKEEKKKENYIEREGYNSQWEFQMDAVVYGKERILPYPLIIFNIENDILIGTEPYYHYITENFFYKYISNGQCDYSILDTNYISFHCNTMIQYIIDEDFPHLEFIINGKTISFTGSDLFLKNNNETLFFIVIFHREISIQNE